MKYLSKLTTIVFAVALIAFIGSTFNFTQSEGIITSYTLDNANSNLIEDVYLTDSNDDDDKFDNGWLADSDDDDDKFDNGWLADSDDDDDKFDNGWLAFITNIA